MCYLISAKVSNLDNLQTQIIQKYCTGLIFYVILPYTLSISLYENTEIILINFYIHKRTYLFAGQTRSNIALDRQIRYGADVYP